MIVTVVVVIPGIALLLIVASSGLLSRHARRSEDPLVAPRNAGYGECSRLSAEATRAQARADLRALTSRKSDRSLTLVVDHESQSNRHAA